ncbi:hypothetical protein [Pseudofulvibacter geojedonensis]|uniref:Uncharacterized protein n=1 Tax=Pseudofulvibacter geojedonensis TaxID=1123758 RepID=A0ABW3I1B3_9FLAO
MRKKTSNIVVVLVILYLSIIVGLNIKGSFDLKSKGVFAISELIEVSKIRYTKRAKFKYWNGEQYAFVFF